MAIEIFYQYFNCYDFTRDNFPVSILPVSILPVQILPVRILPVNIVTGTRYFLWARQPHNPLLTFNIYILCCVKYLLVVLI